MRVHISQRLRVILSCKNNGFCEAGPGINDFSCICLGGTGGSLCQICEGGEAYEPNETFNEAYFVGKVWEPRF